MVPPASAASGPSLGAIHEEGSTNTEQPAAPLAFGSKSLFGSSAVTSTAPPLLFGSKSFAPPVTSSAPLPVFGTAATNNNLTTTAGKDGAPLFAVTSTQASAVSTAASSTPLPIFGTAATNDNLTTTTGKDSTSLFPVASTQAAAVPAVTSSAPSFGTFSTGVFGNFNKQPLAAVDSSEPKRQFSSSIEMASPEATTSAPTATSNIFSFGATSQPSAPVFNFGIPSASSSAPSSLIFNGQSGSLVPPNSTSNVSSNVFQFGAQPAAQPSNVFGLSSSMQAPLPVKTNSAPPSLIEPPKTFNFGGSGTASGFVFGSAAPPATFNFNASTAVPPTLNFGSATTAPSFGDSAATANYFSAAHSGPSAPTARKMLKARRMRK